MAHMMIRCPETGRPVNTGIAVSREIFALAAMQGYLAPCPACRKQHTWEKADAYLES
jgi:endogenous inhibitor of DNA gyrase (YacG/DUF329 family)